QHDRILEQLRGAPRALRVALDELHLLALLERLREAQPDIAGAGEHDLAHARALPTHLVHHAPDRLAPGEKIELVAILDHRVAFGPDHATGAIDRENAHVGPGDVLAQVAHALADREAALASPRADEAHPPLREIEHLQRAGIAHEPLDVLRHQLLGADEHVHRE